MNSPQQLHEVRLRGLGGPGVCGVPCACASAAARVGRLPGVPGTGARATGSVPRAVETAATRARSPPARTRRPGRVRRPMHRSVRNRARRPAPAPSRAPERARPAPSPGRLKPRLQGHEVRLRGLGGPGVCGVPCTGASQPGAAAGSRAIPRICHSEGAPRLTFGRRDPGARLRNLLSAIFASPEAHDTGGHGAHRRAEAVTTRREPGRAPSPPPAARPARGP